MRPFIFFFTNFAKRLTPETLHGKSDKKKKKKKKRFQDSTIKRNNGNKVLNAESYPLSISSYAPCPSFSYKFCQQVDPFRIDDEIRGTCAPPP